MIYQVRDLSLAYGLGPTVVDKANFTLAQGETLTILGPNGAGKSTLLNALMCLHPAREGEILLCGQPIEQMSARDVARSVAYVRQQLSFAFSFEVLDFVVMGCAPHLGPFSRPRQEDYDAAFQALETMGVADLAYRPYTDISGGQRQQVVIARAIVQDPKVILLDEPTAHLDFGNQIRTLELALSLSENGYAVVMTTHDPNHAILMGGKTAILDRAGHLSVGESDTMLQQDVLEELYRVELCVTDVPQIERRACLGRKLRSHDKA
ncbi:MAG: ABC transporter ATP-binding protein [Coriobacteriales bacterium]|nr:ABC transporter ATP-binding protein [Coriobacteriales bacterium]MBQ6585334.1 ABC transporter ATP-binding protein [Coriobacteriales bacterium]